MTWMPVQGTLTSRNGDEEPKWLAYCIEGDEPAAWPLFDNERQCVELCEAMNALDWSEADYFKNQSRVLSAIDDDDITPERIGKITLRIRLRKMGEAMHPYEKLAWAYALIAILLLVMAGLGLISIIGSLDEIKPEGDFQWHSWVSSLLKVYEVTALSWLVARTTRAAYLAGYIGKRKKRD